MLADQRHPTVPMDKVIANELEILGSHGMAAHNYVAMLDLIRVAELHPEKLVEKTISLDEAGAELAAMDNFSGAGVTVIDRF